MPLYVLLALVSVLLQNLYSVSAKRIENRTALFFWSNVFTYVGFLAVYFARRRAEADGGQVLTDLVFRYTLDQAPLYVLYAAGFVGSMLVFRKLLAGYDLSLMMPLSQLSILLTTVGYVALGVRPAWQEVAGLLILSPGLVVVSLPADALSSPALLIGRLRAVSGRLWGLALLMASLTTLTALVTYLGTKATVETTELARALEESLHLQVFFLDPFHFSLGAQFFSVLMFLGVLAPRREDRSALLPALRDGGVIYVLITLMSFVANLAFQKAFELAPEPTILLVINKLSIPIVLGFSVLLLGERLTPPRIAGSGLILGGGLLAALF
jgi:drug/metabolite transporter (DMT)-like permease